MVDVQVAEQLVGEQPVPLLVQQPIDRPLRQLRLASGHRDVAQPALPLGQPQRHRPPSTHENYTSVILPGQGTRSESTPRPKGTTLLGQLA
jgi:hypothetical protein